MKNMRQHLGQYFEIVVFPEAMIVNAPVQDWPVVQVLIAIYSSGFPLPKAQEYAKLRKPWVLNDLDIQNVLLDRTEVYAMLIKAGVATPRHAVVWRDGIHPQADVKEEDDQIVIDGQVFKKPFVEKPVSSENHNVIVYFPSSAGGGSRRLFRKTRERSSEFNSDGKIRRDASYMYEEFLQTNGVDVKVYAVGPEHTYAETRKAPSLDGKVERNADGKEVRYPIPLTLKEKEIARKIVMGLRQTVCGFDLLRTDEESYVCDVNGHSLVKASDKYYDHAAKILRGMILQRFSDPGTSETAPGEAQPILVPTTTGENMELRSVLAVIRHGDRTPKQKMKMVVDHERWTALFEKYRRPGTTEAKLKKPEQLQAVLDLVRELLAAEQHSLTEQTRNKLNQLQTVLEMYGTFSGINRKIQVKKPNESSSELSVTAKWGGELTGAGLLQAEAVGKRFRDLYASKADASGSGFLRLYNTYHHDLKIYASDEGRVQMTAGAFAKGFLAMDADPASMLVHMVKSADTDGLLDDDKKTRKFQDDVKQRLKRFFQLDRELSENEMVELNPLRSEPMSNALRSIGNPRRHCEKVWELASKLCDEIDVRSGEPETKSEKLYEGETWSLIGHRWQKLVEEFRQKGENGQIIFEISKIQDIYDSIKYDIEHNVKHFRSSRCMTELYEKAKLLADVVVPQEYGIEKDEKLAIGRGTCAPLMMKLLSDLKASRYDRSEDGITTNLEPGTSGAMTSPTRRIRTRLYFTSKSHLHSLMNVIRYGDLVEAEDEQWKRAMEYLSKVWEYNYLAQVVILLFENKQQRSGDRYHVELHFSPGVMPYGGVDHLADEFAKLENRGSQPERLISTGVIDQDKSKEEDYVNPPLRTTAVIGTESARPGLWSAKTTPRNPQDVTCYVPPLHALMTLSNRLTYEKMNEFIGRMTMTCVRSESMEDGRQVITYNVKTAQGKQKLKKKSGANQDKM